MRAPGQRGTRISALLSGFVLALGAVVADEPSGSPVPAALGAGSIGVAANGDAPVVAAPATTQDAANTEAVSPEALAALRREFVSLASDLEKNHFLTRLRDNFRWRFRPPTMIREEMLRPHLVAEYTRQFRPIVTTELRLVDGVCQPTQAQRQILEAAARESLELAVKEYADVEIEMQRTLYRSRSRPKWPDPRQRVRDSLAKAAESALPAESSRRIQEDGAKRIAARKRATILYVVAKLDKALVLSAEQREKLEQIVAANWKDDWGRALEVLRYGDYYMPVLPEEPVLEILSEIQQQIWKESNRKDRENIHWGWTGFGFLQPIEEAPEDAAAAEAPAENADKGTAKNETKAEKAAEDEEKEKKEAPAPEEKR
jgi:hypothetical protein